MRMRRCTFHYYLQRYNQSNRKSNISHNCDSEYKEIKSLFVEVATYLLLHQKP